MARYDGVLRKTANRDERPALSRARTRLPVDGVLIARDARGLARTMVTRMEYAVPIMGKKASGLVRLAKLIPLLRAPGTAKQRKERLVRWSRRRPITVPISPTRLRRSIVVVVGKDARVSGGGESEISHTRFVRVGSVRRM